MYGSAPKETEFKFGIKPPAIHSLSVPEFIRLLITFASWRRVERLITDDTQLR